jgi:cysteine desulfurase
VLYLRRGTPWWPLLTGGGQERNRRAGTENVPGVVGFGAAARVAAQDLARQAVAVAALRDEAERSMLEAAPGRARLFGADAPHRLPNTICIALPGVPASTQVMALDLAGVMVSAGAACSSGKVRPSHVLEAMGAGPEEAGSAIRVSFGWNSTAEDVEQLLRAWRQLVQRAGRKAEAA